MNDVQRNFLTAGMVCAASASLIGGIYFRQNVEMGHSGLRASELLAPSLVASKANIPEERYFHDLTALLRREYVDPIGDDLKLATGSVKGMIASLDDEHSLFMTKPVFQAFVKGVQGEFEGIGAAVSLVRNPAAGSKTIRTSLDFLSRVPYVRVSYVVPDGPAARAGIVAGDDIESIDGRWIVSPEIGERFKRIDAQVKAKKLPESARLDLQNEMRAKFENSMMPVRALEKLTVGREGSVEVAWRHGGQVHKAALAKAAVSEPVNRAEGNAFRVAFVPGAAQTLRQALAANRNLVLDLRGSAQGDYKVMLECLSIIAPTGEYGRLMKAKGPGQPVKVIDGADKPYPIRIRVDRETKGVAEAFATALKSKGLAQIEGGATGGDPAIIERTSLPDGSGFTLRVGDYRAPGAKK